MLIPLVKWLCNCFCGGPKPAEDTTLTCTNTGIDGVDSLNGEACTNPTEMETVADLPTDPPQCYGGDTDPCTSAHLYRAVFPCAVPGGCSKVWTMETQASADLALPAPTGYTGCPSCFTLTVSGMGSGVGGMTDECCQDLNGDFELCYRDCDSTSTKLIWQTPCLPIRSVRNQDGGQCTPIDGTIPSIGPFTFPGLTFSSTDPDVFPYGFNGSTEVTFAMTPHFLNGSECPWSGETSISGAINSPVKVTARLLYESGTLHLTAQFATGETHADYSIDPLTLVLGANTFTLVSSSDPMLTTWPTTVSIQFNAGLVLACGPKPAQRIRSKWHLEYDVTETKWSLRSFVAVEHPKYSLVDADPCNGQSKELMYDMESVTSGCITFPPTLTLTPSNDCVCTDNSGTGCNVNLWRQCGETTYQYRHNIMQSAIASENLADDEQDELPTDAGCCNAKYEYIWSPGDCCPTQANDFFGRVDPWKIPVNELVWELDPAADPPTLTGNFSQGVVVFSGDSAMVCDGTTHFTQTSSTLSDISLPKTCCVVADRVMTCNVRELSSPPTTPQQSAGYDEVTGQADFCACNDTCAPSIQGHIIISDSNGAACADQFICYSRQNTITGQDADAKTAFPRIGCIRIWDGEKYNTLTQVVYCAGTTASPNRWASDWYCTTGTIGETLTRQCNSCTAYVGTLLGTTYAIKDECGLLPNFPFPDSSGDCHCAVPTVVSSCCPDDEVPRELTASISSSCTLIGDRTIALTYSEADSEWIGSFAAAPYSFTVHFFCTEEGWHIRIDGTGMEASCSFGAPASSPVCDPFYVDFPTWGAECTFTECPTPSIDSGHVMAG